MMQVTPFFNNVLLLLRSFFLVLLRSSW